MDLSLESFQYFFNIIFPSCILVFGVIGGVFGLILFISSRKLSLMGPVIIYRSLFIYDLLTLVQIVVNILVFSLNILVLNSSSIICKVWNFLNYSVSAISPMLLVYISVDKLITIKYPTRRKYLKNKKYQLIFVFFVSFFNFIYYVPSIIGIDLVNYNGSNTCTYISYDFQNIISFMDLFNRAILPFILMTTFSIALILVVIQSRRRVLANGSISEKKTFRKDVKFSISSITFNIFFLIGNLPVSLLLFFPDFINYLFMYTIVFWLFYLCYAVNFYILFITNSIFRQETIKFSRKFLKCENKNLLFSQS